jgi:hypothetical protein
MQNELLFLHVLSPSNFESISYDVLDEGLRPLRNIEKHLVMKYTFQAFKEQNPFEQVITFLPLYDN